MPRALLSVSNKDGIVAFARDLTDRGWTLVSTGGTARVLRDAGLRVTEISEITGHPEMMEGRVKTLHPAVHAGLLGRRGHAADTEQMRARGYEPIDLVAVNLYPFRETVARKDVTHAEVIENIDIGGPAMLRSAAKNHESVWTVVDPADYDVVLDALDAAPPEALALRRSLAAKVFAHTAAYDEAIYSYLSDAERIAEPDPAGPQPPAPSPTGGEGENSTGPARLPNRLVIALDKVQDLRYGENPDQPAAFYAEQTGGGGLPAMRQLHGKQLSFNNLLDVEGALLAISAWELPDAAACAIVKHTTPCGLATGASAAEAYRKALSTDPASAFGSVVAFNADVSEEVATLLRPNFVEVIVASGFAPGALDLLREKKNVRLMVLPAMPDEDELDFKRVRGGLLVQQRMRMRFPEDGWRVITERQPSSDEWEDLRFAWRAVASVKSNAILLARDGMTLGIGAGQMSRVDASRLAVLKAADNGWDLRGATLASDAFFPFRDGVDAAAEAGIRAVIQPGGSIRDEEVIAAANEHGIAMVFTGHRLFRH